MADAIRLYCEQASSGSQKQLSAIKTEAKNHLSAAGWKIWYGDKGTGQELRYTSPTGTVYYSLRTACKSFMEKEEEKTETSKRKNTTPERRREESPEQIKKPTKPRIKRTGLRVRENIFLEDGRTISVCQSEVNRKSNGGTPPAEDDRSTRICSFCNYGGEMLCCEQCPAAFHVQCLGMRTVPEGNWFCFSCRCGFCGRRTSDSEPSEKCEQCERRFHLDCIREMGKLGAKSRQRKWFCSKGCNKVFSGLHKLIGQPIRIDSQGLTLTWTLFRNRGDSGDVKSQSKLSRALDVMHECFESITDPLTGRDLVEDVVFSKGSELKRLDFKGFYTILLEQEDDDLISVASVRVYGLMVSEMPLVATRWHHRGGGMCRILVNELKKQLRRLGVARLVIPAVPGMLGAWTNKFGFTVIEAPERLKLHEFTFLDFRGTIMCHKMLDSSKRLIITLCVDTSVGRWSNN